MNDAEKNEILSLTKDLGEVTIDSLINEGIFKDIPLLGTGISISKLIKSASDRILLSKIIQFINDLNLKDKNEIDIFKEKYLKKEDYKKIGAKILLILDKADDNLKINWLAKTLIIFLDGQISRYEFLRISSIINSGYAEDIQQIMVFNEKNQITTNNELIENHILDHLFSIGLLQNDGIEAGTFPKSSNYGTIYSLNKFGKIMSENII